MPEEQALAAMERAGLIDKARIERAVLEIIAAIGEDASREGLVETPRRVAEMYAELFSGLERDPAEELTVSFDEAYESLVVLKDLTVSSLCEHHFTPFTGVAHVAYVPRGRVVGVSKLARMVDVISRRPQLQERLTGQVADTLMEVLQPGGVAVMVEAEHMCMTMRGVKRPGSKMVTLVTRGDFETDARLHAQFLALVGKESR